MFYYTGVEEANKQIAKIEEANAQAVSDSKNESSKQVSFEVKEEEEQNPEIVRVDLGDARKTMTTGSTDKL